MWNIGYNLTCGKGRLLEVFLVFFWIGSLFRCEYLEGSNVFFSEFYLVNQSWFVSLWVIFILGRVCVFQSKNKTGRLVELFQKFGFFMCLIFWILWLFGGLCDFKLWYNCVSSELNQYNLIVQVQLIISLFGCCLVIQISDLERPSRWFQSVHSVTNIVRLGISWKNTYELFILKASFASRYTFTFFCSSSTS